MKFTKRDIPTGSGTGSNLFLKLKDGESKTGVCRGEIYEFTIKWEGGKSSVCSPDDEGAKTRFRLNFVVHEDGKFVPKIWEYGLIVYNLLSEIAEEYDLEKTKLKITRRGTGTDTVYMILPLLKEPIPAKTLAEIEAVPLLLLEHKESVKPKPVESFDSEILPF
jgi:hypothetical protein